MHLCYFITTSDCTSFALQKVKALPIGKNQQQDKYNKKMSIIFLHSNITIHLEY